MSCFVVPGRIVQVKDKEVFLILRWGGPAPVPGDRKIVAGRRFFRSGPAIRLGGCIAYGIFMLPKIIRYVVISVLLVLISYRDLRKGIIPDFLVLLLFFWVFIWQLFFPIFSHGSSLTGFLVGGGLFYLIAVLSKGGLGGGDIKLMAVLGLATGWPFVLLVFLLAFLLGAAVGLVLLFARVKTWRSALPFAPFLTLAFLLVAFWGPQIWHWYISFF